MAFSFKNTEADNIMTEEDEEDYRNINKCRFCGRGNLNDKVGGHCHLTGENRWPAHNKCNINVTQKQSNLLTVLFHNFSNYDCHLFFKKLVSKKNDKPKLDVICRTNEEYISISYV